MQYTKEELDKILENHAHWIKEDVEGWQKMRADLRDADLRDANLRDARDSNREQKISNKKEKRKMSEMERLMEEAKADVITISRDEFLSIAVGQTSKGKKIAELCEKEPMLMMFHMLITADLADKLFRKKEEGKGSEESAVHERRT